ncbi:cyclic nucleotide-binding domain-containing protein [Niameybacter massiliensis]|uniref:Cyclic nucleotide-binding domain-containing protein n=1 Tax=Holtiella tumoricola TaxID=3018743 RepID=A0AA42J096_9FIRM|nr:cyclic nucleotide-binding domain-containing protein [Holtiella tumoricola]MDA3731011.1 cyclic nucleotide-binding domain-containing protein [Holtiella tumoricola]
MKKEKVQLRHIEKLLTYGITIEDESEIRLFTYKKGEEILREGFPMAYLLVVVGGKAKVYASAANGRDLLLSYYVADGIVGDVELMSDQYIASTTMIALTDFVCIALPFKSWSERLKTNVTFLNHIGRELAAKLIRCSNKGVATALHDGEKRLCTYLLQVTPDDRLDETLTNVASAIGMSYRHLLRILKVLCEEKILQKEGKGYRVMNRHALESKGFVE